MAVPIALLLAGAGSAYALGGDAGGGRQMLGLHAVRDTTPPFSIGSLTFPAPPTIPKPVVTAAISTGEQGIYEGIPAAITIVVTDTVNRTSSALVWIDGAGPPTLSVQAMTTDTGTCSTDGSEYQCNLGAMFIGQQATIVLDVQPIATGTASLSVSTGPAGLPPGPAAAAVSLVVNPATADLALRLPTGPVKPKIGHRVRIGAVLTNNGPSPEGEATLSFGFPPDVRLVSAVSHQGTCGGTPYLCRFGPMAPHMAVLVVLTVDAVRAGSGHLSARASGEFAVDPAGNDSGSVAIDVPPNPKPRTPATSAPS